MYAKLKSLFGGEIIPLLQQDEKHGAKVVLVPRPVEKAALERAVHPWVYWSLFGLTLITTTWMGAARAAVNLLAEPSRFVAGLPYSLGLLAILGFHELGHYFAARHHGMNVTAPYIHSVRDNTSSRIGRAIQFVQAARISTDESVRVAQYCSAFGTLFSTEPTGAHRVFLR